jgi:hypothetical protein
LTFQSTQNRTEPNTLEVVCCHLPCLGYSGAGQTCAIMPIPFIGGTFRPEPEVSIPQNFTQHRFHLTEQGSAPCVHTLSPRVGVGSNRTFVNIRAGPTLATTAELTRVRLCVCCRTHAISPRQHLSLSHTRLSRQHLSLTAFLHTLFSFALLFDQPPNRCVPLRHSPTLHPRPDLIDTRQPKERHGRTQQFARINGYVCACVITAAFVNDVLTHARGWVWCDAHIVRNTARHASC